MELGLSSGDLNCLRKGFKKPAPKPPVDCSVRALLLGCKPMGPPDGIGLPLEARNRWTGRGLLKGLPFSEGRFGPEQTGVCGDQGDDVVGGGKKGRGKPRASMEGEAGSLRAKVTGPMCQMGQLAE